MDKSMQMSTVQMSVSTKEKLREIADRYRRSMAGQLDWMVDVAYAQMIAEQTPETSGEPTAA